MSFRWFVSQLQNSVVKSPTYSSIVQLRNGFDGKMLPLQSYESHCNIAKRFQTAAITYGLDFQQSNFPLKCDYNIAEVDWNCAAATILLIRSEPATKKKHKLKYFKHAYLLFIEHVNVVSGDGHWFGWAKIKKNHRTGCHSFGPRENHITNRILCATRQTLLSAGLHFGAAANKLCAHCYNAMQSNGRCRFAWRILMWSFSFVRYIIQDWSECSAKEQKWWLRCCYLKKKPFVKVTDMPLVEDIRLDLIACNQTALRMRLNIY